MGAAPTVDQLGGLYDSLSRYHWFCRRLSCARAGAGLEMHKRLNAPAAGVDGPEAGCAGLNEWLLKRLDPPDHSRLLDAGCGFGGTLFCFARSRPGRHVGLTLSPFQARMAQREAARLGLTENCEFRLQSFDDPISGCFDVVVSVEALLHAADLGRAVDNLARSLKPGGILALVEDMLLDQERDAQQEEIAELLGCWSSERLHAVSDFQQALACRGFEIRQQIDLTAQVPYRSRQALDANARRLRSLRRWLPLTGSRRIIDAFLGGVALEGLYERGCMRYLALIASCGDKARDSSAAGAIA